MLFATFRKEQLDKINTNFPKEVRESKKVEVLRNILFFTYMILKP